MTARPVGAPASPIEALLVVVDAGTEPEITAETMVAGLPLGKRIALAAARAGLVPADDAPPGRRRLVLLSGNVIPQIQWLRGLKEMSLEPETVWVDPAMVAVVETDDPKPVLAAAARAASPADLISALSGRTARASCRATSSGASRSR
jgi:hypothetical protein